MLFLDEGRVKGRYWNNDKGFEPMAFQSRGSHSTAVLQPTFSFAVFKSKTRNPAEVKFGQKNRTEKTGASSNWKSQHNRVFELSKKINIGWNSSKGLPNIIYIDEKVPKAFTLYFCVRCGWPSRAFSMKYWKMCMGVCACVGACVWRGCEWL